MHHRDPGDWLGDMVFDAQDSCKLGRHVGCRGPSDAATPAGAGKASHYSLLRHQRVDRIVSGNVADT